MLVEKFVDGQSPKEKRLSVANTLLPPSHVSDPFSSLFPATGGHLYEGRPKNNRKYFFHGLLGFVLLQI
jgi:hypothetical protein